MYRKYLCVSGLGITRKHTVRHPSNHNSNPTDTNNSGRALINQDIGPSPNLGWVGTVWILGSAVGFLLVGRLSDIFGRKWMVIGTTMLSIVGNIVGGTAHTIETLIAANACNGVAAAGQLSFGIVLGELVPNKQRGPIVTLVFMSVRSHYCEEVY